MYMQLTQNMHLSHPCQMPKDKVIFLSSKNPFSKKDWSGIPFFLYQALSKEYHVEYVSLPQFRLIKFLGYYFSKVFFLISRKKYVFDYGLILALLYGVIGSIRLKNTKAKFIFSPAGVTEIAFLKTTLPIVSYGDCSTLQLFNYYPALKDVSKLSYWEISFVEKRAFKRTAFSAFSSAWARDFVETHYGKACSVVPFGSNMSIPINRSPKNLSGNECNLLFIGVDWVRKGGDVVLKVHQCLLAKGIQSRLTIVGTSLPPEVKIPERIQVITHLNKDAQDGQMQMNTLLENADFFLLPTLADCTPIVIAEAYAYGIPVLANETGGIPSMVLDGVTGYLMKNSAQDYLDKIEFLLADKELYSKISLNCLKHSSSTFNWESCIDSLNHKISSSIISGN
jgi:alpha-maltose-1-phosphate synthase